MSDPTDQRHRVFQALQQQGQRGQAPQQPQPPHSQLAMQWAQRLPAPPPQGGFCGVALMPPMQGTVTPAHAAAAAEAAARARAAEQMAYEDAWKACNPDINTPFASIEDAVSRLLPYHVFAEYEDEDDDEGAGSNNRGDATAMEKSSSQKWDEDVEAWQLKFVEEFEKHVTSFNVIARQRAAGADRAEERIMLERALLQQERWQSDRVRAAIQQEQREKEAARARLMLAQSEAVDAWPLVPTDPAAWHQVPPPALRGEVISGAGNTSAPGVVRMPQHDTAASAWQLLQLGVLPTFVGPRGEASTSGQAAAAGLQQQQHQQLNVWPTFAAPRGEASTSGQAAAEAVLLQQQQQLAMWPTFVAPRGEASSSGQVAAATALQQLQQQQQAEAQGPSGAAAGGMVLPWWGSGAPRR